MLYTIKEKRSVSGILSPSTSPTNHILWLYFKQPHNDPVISSKKCFGVNFLHLIFKIITREIVDLVLALTTVYWMTRWGLGGLSNLRLERHRFLIGWCCSLLREVEEIIAAHRLLFSSVIVIVTCTFRRVGITCRTWCWRWNCLFSDARVVALTLTTARWLFHRFAGTWWWWRRLSLWFFTHTKRNMIIRMRRGCGFQRFK